jgi:type IV pilus assembly protein PilM
VHKQDFFSCFGGFVLNPGWGEFVTSFTGKIKQIFSFESDVHVGLDLGASTVKLVALKSNSSSRPKIVSAALLDTPMGCIQDGNLSDGKTLSEVVLAAFSQAGISLKGTKVNVGLKGLNVVHKKINLPNANEEEMAQQVVLEAQQQVDSDLNDWIIDHQVLSKADSQGQVQVMLVAAKRQGVSEYQSLLQGLQLRPVIYDCDVFAIENSFEHAYGMSDEVCLCLDIGRDSTKLNLVQSGIPLLVRSFGLGGGHFTEQISRNLNLNYEHSETLKVSNGHSPEQLQSEEFNSALETHCTELADEIKRTLDFFATQNSNVSVENIDRVILSGGGSLAATLPKRLENILQSSVSFVNPFRNIDGEIPEICKEIPNVFSVAVGLALRSMGDKPK